MVAFLQIVTFAGIYFKLGDIMSMFNLQVMTVSQWADGSCEDRKC